jgi:hypothetical protein
MEDDVHLIVDDHFLNDAARTVGNATVIPYDQLDFSPGHQARDGDDRPGGAVFETEKRLYPRDFIEYRRGAHA